MNLLAIETSSPVLSVAVKKGKDSILQTMLKGYLKHAENLLPLIDQLLKKKKLSLQDVDAFLIGRGPGSFTGLRIGFATLKGLVSLKKKPCYGMWSTDLIAWGIPNQKFPYLSVCLDAKRDKLYTKLYCCQNGTWQSTQTPSLLDLGELTKSLKEKTLMTGDALERYGHALKKSNKELTCLSKKWWYPKASALIECFEKKDPGVKELTKPKDLLPLYLRTSEAEERKQGEK